LTTADGLVTHETWTRRDFLALDACGRRGDRGLSIVLGLLAHLRLPIMRSPNACELDSVDPNQVQLEFGPVLDALLSKPVKSVHRRMCRLS
jgi:hypothetical protein